MRMTTAMGSYRLNRYPLRQNESLQAWDAADEYLLNYCAEQNLPDLASDARPVLVVNDLFGALALSFHAQSCVSWGDSVVANRGAEANFKRNKFPQPAPYIPATQTPEGIFGLVLIKVPKTLALLEHQLASLAGHLDANSVVIAAGMAKNIHNSTLELFAKYLGPTTTSLAVKKARLVFPQLNVVLAGTTPPSPHPGSYRWEEQELDMLNHANVFAREQLDIGARALLSVLDRLPRCEHIVDLGCGNGVLGIAAKILQPQAQLSFVDESYMAVESARANWQQAMDKLGLDASSAGFYANDCLAGLALQDVDLVLCNPPFHEGHAMGEHIAWRMFKQSYDGLQPGGQLWIVGNKHLQYQAKLKRLFGNCTEQYADKKFVVYSATKQKPAA